MVAVVLFEATDLAWPLHERRGWLRLAGTTGLLTLAQQAIAFAATAVPAARRVPFDLAQGGLIGLLAGLFLAQPAGLPLPWALLTTLVVAVAAVATLLVLGARAAQPVWVGLGGLVLFLAVTPDLGGQLAPLALRGLAQAPLGGWLPAVPRTNFSSSEQVSTCTFARRNTSTKVRASISSNPSAKKTNIFFRRYW